MIALLAAALYLGSMVYLTAVRGWSVKDVAPLYIVLAWPYFLAAYALT